MLPLRVPLHAQRESACTAHAHRFDQSVRRSGFDHETHAQLLDTLVMQRVHAHFACTVRETLQQATMRQQDRVRRCVLQIEAILLILAMVAKARDRMNALMQRPAEHHVHFLQATAYGEHWHARRNRGAHQRQRRRIAGCIVQRVRRTRLAAVTVRLEIRITAGEKKTVDSGQYIFRGLTLAQRRQQQCERLRPVDDCRDVFLTNHMRRMMSCRRSIGGNANQWFISHNELTCVFNRVTQRMRNAACAP